MRLAVIRAGKVVNIVEGRVRVVRAMFSHADGYDVIPVADTSAAEPGADATVSLRWAGGRVRRVRFDRSDAYSTTDNHPDTDDDS